MCVCGKYFKLFVFELNTGPNNFKYGYFKELAEVHVNLDNIIYT